MLCDLYKLLSNTHIYTHPLEIIILKNCMLVKKTRTFRAVHTVLRYKTTELFVKKLTGYFACKLGTNAGLHPPTK